MIGGDRKKKGVEEEEQSTQRGLVVFGAVIPPNQPTSPKASPKTQFQTSDL